MYRLLIFLLSIAILPLPGFAIVPERYDLAESENNAVRAYLNHTEHVDHETGTVPSEPLDRAIDGLRPAYEAAKDKARRRKLGLLLLHSYYLKGTYALRDSSKKQAVFSRGKKLGASMVKTYPDDARVHLLYAANLGRWGQAYGIVSAAREGIGSTLRSEARRIIELDKEEADAGGYRLLARLHYRTPYIPFVASWPSMDRALSLLDRATDIAPDHPGNNFFYGKYLYEAGEKKKGKKYLKKAARAEPRDDPRYLLDDLRYSQKAQDFLNTNVNEANKTAF